MIIALILILACASENTEPKSYAEKNGWTEIKPPRPDLQCWRRGGASDAVCVKSLNYTHGAFDGNN